MAEEPIISTFVGNIIRRLSSAAVQKIGLMWGVNEELEELKEAILRIKSLVVHAEEKLQIHDNDSNEVRRWLKRLEDAVFEADDLMDEFSSYEAQRMGIMANSKEVTKKVCTTFYSTSNKLLLAGFRRQKIKTMHDRLVSIRDDRKFHLEENYTINNTPSLKDREKMAIIECLLDVKINEENNVSVFPILYYRWESDKIGLAGAVFDNEKVINHFDLKMWLDTSRYDEFNKTGPIRQMLKSATNKDFDENIEMDQLHKELCEMVKGKRYLLVLHRTDTETDEILLESLEYLLSLDCANGSKIVVIGCGLDDFIDFMSAVEPYIYKRSLLGPEESWDLFKNVVFKNNEQEEAMNLNNSKIVEIGKSIVERCGGKPYTIRTIGRMLLDYSSNNNNPAEKETEYWFSGFLKFFSKVPPKDIYKLLVLKLGFYDILPLPLKRCFVYCCRLFPKGFEFDVKILINLWVAQGFIDSDSSSEKSMEDVGYEYVEYLTQRCFIKYYKVGKSGLIENFTMLNIMHDLAILVSSGGTMTMFATLNNEFDDDEHRIDRRSTRYASFHLDHQDSSSKIPNSVVFQAKSIRALIVLHNDQSSRETEEGLSQSICDKIMLNCKLLRVLDLHSLRMEVVPNSIGKLKHLTYLDISGNTDIKALPNSITMLHCLITLKLSSCYGLEELPRDFKKLISLKHLEIDGCYSLTRMPRGLGQLTQLETLSEFVLLSKGNIGNSCSLKELATLNSLRGKLKIKNLGIMEDSEQSNQILERKEHLRSLTLSWDLTRSVIDNASNADEKQLECLEPHTNIEELALVGYEGIEFCNWLSSLNKLVSFSLRKCKCEHLSPLVHLPCLEVLKLEEMSNLKYIISNDVQYDTSGRDYFRKLNEVRLTELPNLEGWWQQQQQQHPTISFGSLWKMVIEDCPKLRSMPLYLYLEDCLVLDNTSFDTFQQTINADQSDNYSFTPLSQLRSLCIIGIKKLDITQCDNIKWERLKSLRFLRFDYLPKLDKLPDGLQRLTTLRRLHIWRCNITALPDWIGNFKLLERLGISVCPYLKSLPQTLQRLKHLDTLEIVDCPILFQRCQTETGADWDKVKHIRNLQLHQS